MCRDLHGLPLRNVSPSLEGDEGDDDAVADEGEEADGDDGGDDDDDDGGDDDDHASVLLRLPLVMT